MRYLGKTILNGLLIGAAAGAATVGFASKSYADALAFSSLEISNFVVLSGGSQLNAGDFDVLQIGNFGKSEATLDGSGNVSSNPNDPSLICIGSCGGIGQNDFSQQPLPASQFSRADAVLTGAAIVPGGANSSTVAEVQLNTTPSTGTAGSNTGTGTLFSFNLANDQALTFEFNGDAFLRTMLTDPDVNSFASMAWSLGIQDPSGATIFSFVPTGAGGGDPCSLNQSITVLDPGDDSYTCSGAFSTTTGVLDADVTYRLVINHESAANAAITAVPAPEPAAAGLLGLGLIGLARLRRRMAK